MCKNFLYVLYGVEVKARALGHQEGRLSDIIAIPKSIFSKFNLLLNGSKVIDSYCCALKNNFHFNPNLIFTQEKNNELISIKLRMFPDPGLNNLLSNCVY